MHTGAVILMILLGLALVVGIVLTLWWGGARYRPWEPAPPDMPGA